MRSIEFLKEFVSPNSGGGGDEEDILFKYARLWYAAEDNEQKQIQIENLLEKMGWEIGYDEGYDDEPGVFVVKAGDTNGDSYISWSPEDLRGY